MTTSFALANVAAVRGCLAMVLAVVGLLAVGCGDDGDSAEGVAAGGGVDRTVADDPVSDEPADSEGPDRSALLELLPEGDQAAWVDLAEMRDQLGLDPDDDLSATDDEAARRALFAAGAAVPYLAVPSPDLAVKAAIDLGSVRAAASAPYGFSAEQALAVLVTEQSPEEITAAFEGQGWTQDGDLVVAPDGTVVSAEVYTAAGFLDGLVLLGQDAAVVQAAVDGEHRGPGPAAEWLDEVDGPLRSAAVTDPDDCFGAAAASESFTDDLGGGELVVAAGDATAADVPFAPGDNFDRRGDPDSGFYTAEAVELADGRLEVEWSYSDGPGVSSLVFSVTGDFSIGANWVLACN